MTNTMIKLQTAIASMLLVAAPVVSFAKGNAAEGQNKSATCQACHGETGIATQAIYPNLAGQHEDYLEKALLDYRDGHRVNAVMSNFALNLTNEDIEDLAAWFSSQKGLTEIKDK